MNKTPRTSRRIVVFGILLVVLCGLSFGLGRSGRESAPGATTTTGASTYYCSMHPHIRSPEPGSCSICGMDLIPLVDSDDDPGPRAIVVSETAMKRAEIETAVVERRALEKDVRLVGKVAFDETRVKTITAWVPGRLDRLYVDYTGVPVKEGEHLADIYSPELIAAQQELLEAKKAVDRDAGSPRLQESSQRTLEAVREKLRLWGLSPDQIQTIEGRTSPSDHIVINAPMGGVVVSKLADQGDYVKTGSPIYKIAELSQLWVVLDAYESDLQWLRYGQSVEFTTESFPGQGFEGRIAFIDWVVAADTRTVKVRVNVENTEGRLKPGMFVRAAVRAALAGGGGVMDPSLAGKWVCPMHPDVVGSEHDDCTACGMDLVPAERLFGGGGPAGVEPLVVPVTAPLLTGKRAVVYVRLPDRERPTFEGREVVLGPRTRDYYVVVEGLEAGEEVVVRGNFKIDSALQIQAKPSMMNPASRPTSQPTSRPASQPASQPTSQPATQPTTQPTTQPASQPASQPAGSGGRR